MNQLVFHFSFLFFIVFNNLGCVFVSNMGYGSYDHYRDIDASLYWEFMEG